MPEDWQVGVFIHVVAVFALGGATVVSLISLNKIRASQTVQEVRFWGGLGRLLSQYQVFPVTGLVLILSGGYLVEDLGLEWTTGWIGYSALAVVAALTAGLTLITPRMKAIGMAAGPAPDGPLPDALDRQIHDPIIICASYANALIALAIIWNMTVRPENAVAAASLLIAAGIGVTLGYVSNMTGT